MNTNEETVRTCLNLSETSSTSEFSHFPWVLVAKVHCLETLNLEAITVLHIYNHVCSYMYMYVCTYVFTDLHAFPDLELWVFKIISFLNVTKGRNNNREISNAVEYLRPPILFIRSKNCKKKNLTLLVKKKNNNNKPTKSNKKKKKRTCKWKQFVLPLCLFLFY